ncbi:MAG: recombinase zinc beta ribbon domain-containing protein [Pseudoruminococcus massiliensis]|uniref:zinc ribbon domain-containing protein n=1 Tax=Pseudoruminococcus massiliensis TaxID=2086583 RepID=UPI003992C836|nr:recombinase zinc beta ribbon domain-containing protein [Oscillospiraceae bacterium]
MRKTYLHEAIIPRKLYAKVQEELLRRANLHSGKDRKKIVYSSKYALSSICYCSKCGDIYRRTAWNNRGKKHNVWRCVNRIERGPDICDAPTVEEEELKAAVVRAINQVLGGKDEMLETLEENIRTVLALGDDNSLESTNERMEELQKELLKTANAHKDYSDLADEIDRLRKQKQNLMTKSAEREGLKQRVAEMKEFLNEQIGKIEEYDEGNINCFIYGSMCMKYLSIRQTAEKWEISIRRIQVLCNEGRIPGAVKICSYWAIPEDAEKPTDLRIKSGKYIKKDIGLK